MTTPLKIYCAVVGIPFALFLFMVLIINVLGL